jgi:hypothetical protein
MTNATKSRRSLSYVATVQGNDVTPFIGPGLMRVGSCGHAATPC